MLLLVFICNSFVVAFATYNCATNATVNLKLNEIIFFETPDYPSIINMEIFMNSNFTFILDDNSKNDEIRVTLVFTIIYGRPYTHIRFLNTSSISLQNYLRYEFNINSYPIQGYAFFEIWKNNSCPFESLSKRKSFKFTDNTENIYIQSSYVNRSLYNYENRDPGGTSLRTYSCRWRFNAPFEHGFKIAVTRANLTSNTEFIIENSTDVIVDSTTVKENYAIYNSDDYIEIILSNPFNALELQIAISVVKLNASKIDGACVTESQEKKVIWYSPFYNSSGYERNIYCEHTEIINSDFEIYVRIPVYSVEAYADYVSYYVENENIVYRLPGDLSTYFFLTHFANGSSKIVHFEFQSDDSVQARGFRLEFQKIYCICSDPIFSCDGGIHTIMKDEGYVCQNLKCNFTIESCKTELTNLKIWYQSKDDDVFKIFSNGDVVFDPHTLQHSNENDYVYDHFNVYLNSSYTNYIEIQTSSNPGVYFSRIEIHEHKLNPPDVDIILSLESPTYILDPWIFNFAAFELADSLKNKNTSITIYGNDNGFWPSFYSNKSLSFTVNGQNCDYHNKALPYNFYIPYKCYIDDRDKFVIYEPDIPGNFKYFVVSLTKQEGCALEDNVFFIHSINFTFSSLATNKGPCLITFFNDVGSVRYITYLWTTSKTENVQVFVGTDQSKLFFEFNSKTAKKWQNIILSSVIYTIKIPKNASIFIKVSNIDKMTVDILESPYQSLITTPEYGFVFCEQSESSLFLTYSIGNVNVKFTALNYSITEGNDFHFQNGNSAFRFNKAGDSLTFRNQSIDLHYNCKYTPGDSIQNGVVIFVEALDNIKRIGI